MAVVLGINVVVSNDRKSLEFYETTGPYSATNTTGWGAPNEAISDATEAELTVETPAENSYTFDSTSVTPLYSDWPTTDDDTSYDIPNSDIGYGVSENLPDGVYRFNYIVTTGTTTYEQTIEKLFWHNAKCCVFNMFADIDYNCDCSTDKLEKAKKAYLLMKGLEYASKCGQKDYFENLLEDLEKLCAGDCTNC
jgi:hypothetical protein